MSNIPDFKVVAFAGELSKRQITFMQNLCIAKGAGYERLVQEPVKQYHCNEDVVLHTSSVSNIVMDDLRFGVENGKFFIKRHYGNVTQRKVHEHYTYALDMLQTLPDYEEQHKVSVYLGNLHPKMINAILGGGTVDDEIRYITKYIDSRCYHYTEDQYQRYQKGGKCIYSLSEKEQEIFLTNNVVPERLRKVFNSLGIPSKKYTEIVEVPLVIEMPVLKEPSYTTPEGLYAERYLQFNISSTLSASSSVPDTIINAYAEEYDENYKISFNK